MTADEVWQGIVFWHRYYYLELKAYGYKYEKVVHAFSELSDLEKIENPSEQQLLFYRNLFKNRIYNINDLTKIDDLLAAKVIPSLQYAVEQLKPIIKNAKIKIPGKLTILTTYGDGGAYNYADNEIYLEMTNRPRDRILGTVLHEFIHLLIEVPIIQKYNVPQDLKERIVDIICLEYFDRPVQAMFENSFANKYITRNSIENDLPGAVKQMMNDYVIFKKKQQEPSKKSVTVGQMAQT